MLLPAGGGPGFWAAKVANNDGVVVAGAMFVVKEVVVDAGDSDFVA